MNNRNEVLSIPISVLQDAEFVMSRAGDVYINGDAILFLSKQVEARLAQGVDAIELAFGTTGNLEKDINMIFFETSVNFCFWGDSTQAKWVIERDGRKFGGWYALAACFDRAVEEGVPVYDARFMAELTLQQARKLFAGAQGSPEIPLLEQRVKNLNEAARYLLENYSGGALHLLESVHFSAPRLAEKVALEIPSFRDGALYDGRWVWILKRAQILASDLSQLHARYPKFILEECDKLTAFADYRLPQVMRHYGVLSYSDPLSQTIDNGRLLVSGCSEEVEIRAATIMVCELIKKACPTRSSADIDLGLWLLSQDMRDDVSLRPHHRTLGQFY